MYTGIMLLLLFVPLFCFYFSNIENFRHSGTVRPRKLVHTWTVGRCIVCTTIMLLLHIYPFISSFFFLSNFQTLIFFFTLFSEIVRPRRLKLGTHMDSGQIYRVYRNQAAAAYSPFYFFIFLSLNVFVTLFSGTLRLRRLKLDTHMDSGQMYRVYWNQLLLLIHPFISSFFFLSIIIFFCFSNF